MMPLLLMPELEAPLVIQETAERPQAVRQIPLVARVAMAPILLGAAAPMAERVAPVLLLRLEVHRAAVVVVKKELAHFLRAVVVVATVHGPMQRELSLLGRLFPLLLEPADLELKRGLSKAATERLGK